MSAKPKVVVIVGPTASGKSDLAVTLAQQFHGEVVSADSRQVYRKLNIGTGKITPREMRGIPHHLIDIVSPQKRFDAAAYVERATAVINDIHRRGNLPIICGGTGYYIDAIIHGVQFPNVPPQPTLRTSLEHLEADALYHKLQQLDPKRALTIDRKNPRRLIRAIEIATVLGHVPAQTTSRSYETLWIGITVPKEELRVRIHERLMARINAGMIDEVSTLHEKGLSWKRMDELGLEYRIIARYLRKQISQQELCVELEREIMRYAKRQITWWRRYKEIIWLSRSQLDQAPIIVERFLNNNNQKQATTSVGTS